MTWEECAAFTRAMAGSGAVLDWAGAGLDGPILDKHSTGGVGDTVSLILAPLVAACGGFVPMISGRALGHTGGTLDKLASIPGYDTAPDLARFRKAVRQAGCAIVGPTAELAPAERRFYAIRDVTATIDSIPLITASILSKKLAAGLDALVMDVKVGSGAFAGSLETAQALAESLVTVAGDAGLRTVAWLTDMNQVLGHDVGNALEVREAIDFLTGRRREARLHAVTSALAREMLVLGGLALDPAAAAGPGERALTSGTAAERFARMVVALGGPGDLLERPERHLSAAPVRLAVTPERAGIVTRVDARMIGLVVVALGGGRRRAKDAVDPAVGLADMRGPGDAVGPDRPLAVVHARSTADAEAAALAVRGAMTVAEEPPPAAGPPVLRRIGAPP
jgi:thymidine phosphorylase